MTRWFLVVAFLLGCTAPVRLRVSSPRGQACLDACRVTHYDRGKEYACAEACPTATTANEKPCAGATNCLTVHRADTNVIVGALIGIAMLGISALAVAADAVAIR